jgi:predicted DNA-binding helix-hairpin-helix protein
MRTFVLAALLFLPALAGAKNVSPSASEPVDEIRVLGRLNVNAATRDALLAVPGMEATMVDAILEARQHAPIDDLSRLAVPVPAETATHLKTDGTSDFRRIRQLPLQVVDRIRTANR